MKLSKTRELIAEDYEKAFNNALVFAMPAVLLIGTTLIADMREAGQGVFVLFLLNLLLDLGRKWYQTKKYK